MNLFNFNKKENKELVHKDNDKDSTVLASHIDKPINSANTTKSFNNLLAIKFKKLNAESNIPDYDTPNDNKIDLMSIDCSFDIKKKLFVYHTGLSVDIPEGFVMLIVPIPSLEDNGFYIPNNFGVIHSGDQKEITVEFKNTNSTFASQPYQVGEVVAQFIILPYPRIKTLLAE